MSRNIPPGIAFITRCLIKLLLPVASVHLFFAIAQNALNVEIPSWLVVFISTAFFPCTTAISIWWTLFKNERNAQAMGAVLVPTIESKWPAGLNILAKMVKSKGTEYLGQSFEKWAFEYGHVFSWRILYADRIVTTEPDHIKSIHSTNFSNFQRGEFAHTVMEPLLGDGVFNVDGDLWKFHRSMTRPFFSKERTSHFDIFDRHAEDAISQMKARFREGHPVDIQDLTSRFTLDSATEFLFGFDVCSLSAGLVYPPGISEHIERPSHASEAFASAFLSAQAIISKRIRLGPLWPLAEFWEDNIKKHTQIVSKFIDLLIDNYLKDQEKVQAHEGIDKQDTLLGHLVNLTKDPKIIKDETTNVLVAGRDTTSSTLTFAVYLLSQHPEAYTRLRQEVLQKLGKRKRPNFDDLRDLKYLRAVINETLRLFPPLPFIMRSCTTPTLWSNPNSDKPFYIPANTRCVSSSFLMHRRTDLWGPDAQEFDPDRFLDERLQKYLLPNPFIFLPFSAGPRICVGQQFAYNEISFLLIRIAQSFSNIVLCPEADPRSAPPAAWAEGIGRKTKEKIFFKAHLTMHAEHGCWIKMTEADDEED